jgi:multimeric flavodoxin WrbA
MKVVAVNGSARRDGNTAILLRTVMKELEKEGVETELLQMAGKKVNGCLACYKCFDNEDMKCVQKDDGNFFIAKMLAADGILMGSPVYYTDVSAQMKGLMERAGFVAGANGNPLKRKAGAAVVAVRRGGAIHTFDTLNHFFQILEMVIPGSTYWNMGIGREPGQVRKDAEGMRNMKNLGKNMAWLMKKLEG